MGKLLVLIGLAIAGVGLLVMLGVPFASFVITSDSTRRWSSTEQIKEKR